MSFLGSALARAVAIACALTAAAAAYSFNAIVIPLSVCDYPPSVTNPNMACDFEQWSQVADQWLAANQPGLSRFYAHRIYVLPRGIKSCTWGGMGWVGCSSSGAVCKVWIIGEASLEPMMYFHELGHNLGMNHANTPNLEYGDSSDAMGFCCGVRCFNAAHLDQLGWAKAVHELDIAALPPSQWHAVDLPASSSNGTAPPPFIKVTSPTEVVYAQLRTKHGHDIGIPATGVYLYNTPPLADGHTQQYGWLESARQLFRAGSGLQIKLAQDLSLQQQQQQVRLLLCTGMCY
ncbi:hypothetical protein OEZ85_011077 [Tetradesmus obliquus]|uniref:Peptidase M11 gametolysin domain-containing protein n=1 Tax=Tetradesmus obliquus TaxID=3088 RepID=A0ABY8TP71_TETOB|nr:hypothetical protein OEZ85_011077 [Tetradesmus obliquus]